MLNNMAKAYPEDCAHGDYNADLIKIDGSISSSGSVETASPGEMGLTLPEEQKLVKKKGGRKPVSVHRRTSRKQFLLSIKHAFH